MCFTLVPGYQEWYEDFEDEVHEGGARDKLLVGKGQEAVDWYAGRVCMMQTCSLPFNFLCLYTLAPRYTGIEKKLEAARAEEKEALDEAEANEDDGKKKKKDKKAKKKEKEK